MLKNQAVSIDFIAGMPRSGTTLLLSILNTSEEVLCIPEIPISIYAFSSFKNKSSFTKKDLSIWLGLQAKLPAIRKIEVNKQLFEDSIDKVKSYKEFLFLVYASLVFPLPKNEYTRIIDKDHTHTFQTCFLNTTFPNSNNVLLIRNPMAFVNSNIEKPDVNSSEKSVSFFSFVWLEYAKQISKLLETDISNRYLLVKYEDLVLNPEKTIRLICSHLKIVFSDKMLAFQDSKYNDLVVSNKLKPEQLDRMHSKYDALRLEINTNRLSSWETKLSKEDQSIIAEITYNYALLFKYSDNETMNVNRKRNFVLKRKVALYFKFSKYFYLLPIKLRELYKVKI